jgi:hypothetical protein
MSKALGSTGIVIGFGIAIDASNNAYITGVNLRVPLIRLEQELFSTDQCGNNDIF